MTDLVLRDVRYAFRTMGREPLVAALTVLTLGIGIGVVTDVRGRWPPAP